MTQCCKSIYRTGYRGRQCAKSAKVEREGKWYCGTHDPEAVANRHNARVAEWQAAQEASRNLREQRDAALDHQRRIAEFGQWCMVEFEFERGIKWFEGQDKARELGLLP